MVTILQMDIVLIFFVKMIRLMYKKYLTITLPKLSLHLKIKSIKNYLQDDPKLLGYNLEEKVNNFIKVAQEWADPYDSGHVLMTMGSDFQYMCARTWYKNLDKLIK